MAHFAKVVNGIVEQVVVADTAEWCETNLGGTWIQTSYNTFANTHVLGGTPLHKNYAGIGYTWDGIGFAQPRQFNSWTFNNDKYIWEAPTPMPTDGKLYYWDEPTASWVETPEL
jgi:hypothetical protein